MACRNAPVCGIGEEQFLLGASLAEGLVVLVDLSDVFAGEPVFLAPAEEGEGLGVDVGVSHGRLVIDPCGLEAEEAARLVIVRQRLQVVHSL